MGSHLLGEGTWDSVPERGSELWIMPQRMADVNPLGVSLPPPEGHPSLKGSKVKDYRA